MKKFIKVFFFSGCIGLFTQNINGSHDANPLAARSKSPDRDFRRFSPPPRSPGPATAHRLFTPHSPTIHSYPTKDESVAFVFATSGVSPEGHRLTVARSESPQPDASRVLPQASDQSSSALEILDMFLPVVNPASPVQSDPAGGNSLMNAPVNGTDMFGYPVRRVPISPASGLTASSSNGLVTATISPNSTEPEFESDCWKRFIACILRCVNKQD